MLRFNTKVLSMILNNWIILRYTPLNKTNCNQNITTWVNSNFITDGTSYIAYALDNVTSRNDCYNMDFIVVSLNKVGYR